MAAKNAALALLVMAVLATAGFAVGRFAFGRSASEADQPVVRQQLDEIATQQAMKDSEDRFIGELLGIHIGPAATDIRGDIWEEDSQLTSHGCGPAPVTKAASLDLPRPLRLPENYTISDEDSAGTGMNPWALECDGIIRSRGWDYATAGVEDIPGKAVVVRLIVRYDLQSVAESQVSVERVGARDAVVIRPASSSGLAQRYVFYFPESFGMTVVHTFNLDEGAALEFANAVAEATQ